MLLILMLSLQGSGYKKDNRYVHIYLFDWRCHQHQYYEYTISFYPTNPCLLIFIKYAKNSKTSHV